MCMVPSVPDTADRTAWLAQRFGDLDLADPVHNARHGSLDGVARVVEAGRRAIPRIRHTGSGVSAGVVVTQPAEVGRARRHGEHLANVDVFHPDYQVSGGDLLRVQLMRPVPIVPVAAPGEYRGRAKIHRLAELLSAGCGAAKFNIGDTGLSCSPLSYPFRHWRAADIAPAHEQHSYRSFLAARRPSHASRRPGRKAFSRRVRAGRH